MTLLRNGHGGWVLLYIREDIEYTEITNVAGSEIDGAWENIHCDKQDIAFGMMYRPPSSNNAYIKYMLVQIDNVVYYHENIIIVGDLNYDYEIDDSLSSNQPHQYILAGERINLLKSGLFFKMFLYISATIVHTCRRDVYSIEIIHG